MLPSPDLDLRGRGEDLVDVEAVVVAGAHDALQPAALEALVGPRDPVAHGLAHELVEQLVQLVRVAGVLVALGGRHDGRVVAVVADEAQLWPRARPRPGSRGGCPACGSSSARSPRR